MEPLPPLRPHWYQEGATNPIWLWDYVHPDVPYQPSADLLAYISLSNNASSWLLGGWCIKSISFIKKKKLLKSCKIRRVLFLIQYIIQKLHGSSGWQGCQSVARVLGAVWVHWAQDYTLQKPNQCWFFGVFLFFKFTCWLQRRSPLKSKSFKA